MQSDGFRFYRPLTLMVDVTERCPNECGHCGYECGPYGKSLSKGVITDMMSDAGEEGIKLLSIGGGEPFCSRNIYHTISEADKNGIKTYSLMSSGYFGRTKANAERVMRKLKESGFSPDEVDIKTHFGKTEKSTTHFQLSMDNFHKEFVHPKYVFNAIGAYCKVFGSPDGLEINLSYLKDDIEDLKKVANIVAIIIEKYGSRAGSKPGKVEFNFSPIVRAGRAKKIDGSSFLTWPVRKVLKDIKKRYPCIGPVSDGDVLVIRGDGSAYPCCSLFYKDMSRLKVGNVNNDSLHEIIEHVNEDPLMNYMMMSTVHSMFGKFGEAMLERDGGYLDREITHDCEICMDMLTDDIMLAKIEKRAAKKLPIIMKNQKKLCENIYPKPSI